MVRDVSRNSLKERQECHGSIEGMNAGSLEGVRVAGLQNGLQVCTDSVGPRPIPCPAAVVDKKEPDESDWGLLQRMWDYDK